MSVIRWFRVYLFIFDISPEPLDKYIIDARPFLPSILNFVPSRQSTYSVKIGHVNWLPWSVFNISGAPKCIMAISRHSLHHLAVMVLDNDYPTIKRLYRSIIATKYI